MQRIATLSVISLILAGGSAWAGCDYPDEPKNLDAEEMTLAELEAAHAEFKEFQAALVDYRECLENDFEQLDEDSQTPERRKLMNIQYNASVEREEELAALLNKHIRAHRKANEEKESQENNSQ